VLVSRAEYLQSNCQSIRQLDIYIKHNPDLEKLFINDKALVSKNIHNDQISVPFANLYQAINLKSIISVPTSYNSEVNGVISVHQYDDFPTWTNDEIEFLEAVANQVGIALAHAQFSEQEKQQKEQLTRQNLELAATKQAAVAPNHAKSEFLTNMSHELRTPLNGILGIAQVFQHLPKLTNQEKEDIAIFEKSGLYLLTLINEILDISKIEVGKMELEHQNFNFPDFLKGIVGTYCNSSAEKNIDFIYQFSSDIPVVVKADEKRLRQILLNLLGNAIKFTSRGKVKFTVNVISKETQNESLSLTKVKFEISDTGIGIPAEKLSKIFLAFEQVGATQLKAQGTGLGLAISQKIARMMGSDITVISKLGKGSIFSFYLDLNTVLNSPKKLTPKIKIDR
jgi:signal transduction histidine kinase